MDKRVEIIRAALGAFSSMGFDGSSLSKIAETAGTNKQLITHHFGSKQNLWQEVVDHELQDGIELIRRVRDTERSDGPLPALRQFINDYVTWVATKSAFHKMLFLEGQQNSPRLDWFTKAHVAPSAKVVMRLIAACQEQGAVRTGEVGRMYFTILHLATSPFVHAYQYQLLVGCPPSGETELTYQTAVISEFLGLPSGNGL